MNKINKILRREGTTVFLFIAGMILFTIFMVWLFVPSKGELLRQTEAGRVLGAEIIISSYNSPDFTAVRTDQGQFHLMGIYSILIGEQTYRRYYSNECVYLCGTELLTCGLISGKQKCRFDTPRRFDE